VQLAAAEAPPESADSAFGGVGDGGAVQTVSGGGLPVPVRAGLYTPSALPVPTVVGAEPAPTPVAEVPKPDLATSMPAPAPVASVPTLPAQPDLSAVQPISAEAVAAPQSPAEVLPQMYQLPYGLRKDLPKLSLTMHVYSPVPEERFVVLNGKRYTLESLAPGPDLNLIEIVADGVVMEFRGQRFLLPRQAY
jgi:general secretion pathway protein B